MDEGSGREEAEGRERACPAGEGASEFVARGGIGDEQSLSPLVTIGLR